MPIASRERQLCDFLVDAFSLSELKRFVMQVLPQVEAVVAWQGGGRAQVSTQVVNALLRRGLIDAEFFQALIRERPRRAEEIAKVAAAWGVRESVDVLQERSEDADRSRGDAAHSPVDEILPINKVFRTTGVPDINFVPPAQLPQITGRLRLMGRALIVEGASGVGKTTALRRALGSLSLADDRLTWIAAKDPQDQVRLRQVLQAGARGLSGYLVVDDFHHLSAELRRGVADLVKVVADRSNDDTKIVLVGINPLGDSLVVDFHDLTGRFDVVRMNRQPEDRITALVKKGEHAANVSFEQREAIVRAARGSFYTAQTLCLEMCMMEGIFETLSKRRVIAAGPHGAVLDRIRNNLRFKYHRRLVSFASFGRTTPAEGATLALLFVLREQFEDAAVLTTTKARFPAVAEELDWLLESNLSRLLHEEPGLAELFFYNAEAGVLSAEDPQLDFYLDHLQWPALARDAGLHHVQWEGDLPIFASEDPTPRPVPSPGRRIHQPPSWVLHLSDLHIASRRDALRLADQVREDLDRNLGIQAVAAIVVSGDIGNTGTAVEYEAAFDFFKALRDDLALGPHQLVLVPGNHDLDWNLSKKAYRVVRKADWTGESEDCSHFESGDYVEVARLNDLQARFKAFANLYFEVRNEHYSLDPDHQATVHHFPDARLLFVGLNSAWAIDHHHTARADINSVALGRVLARIDRETAYQDAMRIAVWHHPVSGSGEDRIRDSGFLERLATAGFRLGLHGHIHKSQSGLFRLDVSQDGRRLDILGAGTFGAPTREWEPGFPLQYQLLHFEGSTVTVHTRRREEPRGAWKPDARWGQGPGEDPLPRYTIDL